MRIGLQIGELLKDITPYLLLTVGVMMAVWWLTNPIDNIYLRFFVKVVTVAVGYCIALWLLGSKIFLESIRFLGRLIVTCYVVGRAGNVCCCPLSTRCSFICCFTFHTQL